MQNTIRSIGISLYFLSQVIACSERPKLPSSAEPQSGKQKNSEVPSTSTSENTSADTPDAPAPAAPAPASPPVAAADKPSVSPAAASTTASGTTTISFTPVTYATAKFPAFVYAIWITDSTGKYVKTVSARAATRMRFLDKWLAAAGVVAPTQPDGVAGASITYPAAPAPIAVTWDMKNKAGVFVPQGNYTINIQMTSADDTGLSLAIPVSISATGITKTDTTMATGITAVSAKYTP